MEFYTQKHYKSVEKALKAVGFQVYGIQKKGNKTVITVLPGTEENLDISLRNRCEIFSKTKEFN